MCTSSLFALKIILANAQLALPFRILLQLIAYLLEAAATVLLLVKLS